jgi:formyltetrahydrofolate-dependent phosphoribosylglycinamide formyltransferase
VRSRIAVLASGGGSNMQAVLDHFARLGNARGGDVVVVASDRAAAGALTRARGAGIAAEALASPSDAAELKSLLERHAVDMIALAGYLKLVPREVVARYEQRIVNVHPALLPAFGGPGMYGRRVHQAVLDSGATVSGATVHFADQEYDHGKIIAQWPVPVRPGDDAASLAARVLRVEHLLYPRVLDALAAGRITVSSCRLPLSAGDAAFTLRPSDAEDTYLANEIEHALGC